MQYYIKEWHDQTASLIAEDGYFLDTFENVDQAVGACVEDCMVEPAFIQKHSNYLGSAPTDFESSFINSLDRASQTARLRKLLL